MHRYILPPIPSRVASPLDIDLISPVNAADYLHSLRGQFPTLVLVGPKGPFHVRRSDDFIDPLAKIACRLFPLGRHRILGFPDMDHQKNITTSPNAYTGERHQRR